MPPGPHLGGEGSDRKRAELAATVSYWLGAITGLGVILGMAGRYRESEENLRTALDIARILLAEPDARTEYTGTVVDILVALGNTLNRLAGLPESRDALPRGRGTSGEACRRLPRVSGLSIRTRTQPVALYRLLEAASTPHEAEELRTSGMSLRWKGW